jgi:predicted anti-sigma-YlaC factor YlaD
MNHVNNLFLRWHEKRLPGADLTRVDDHLKTCAECRRYFESASSILTPGESPTPASLVPDPFLPERAKAIAAGRESSRASGVAARLIRPEVAIVGAALAIAAGILLGRSNPGTTQHQEQFDVTDYYRAFSQHGFTENFDTVFTSNRKEPQ